MAKFYLMYFQICGSDGPHQQRIHIVLETPQMRFCQKI